MTPQVYAIVLAVAACMVGGGIGGFLLAAPQAATERLGLRLEAQGTGLFHARAAGGAMLAAHAVAALALGYAPLAGSLMAAGLALAWLGWAAGGLAQPQTGRGGVLLAILAGASLLAPFWSFGRVMLRGTLV